MTHLHIITTGGSIDKYYSTQKSDFIVGDTQVIRLLSQANTSITFTIESILAKDSLDLTEDDRDLICQHVLAAPCSRIIITHGTDTMVQTAERLSRIQNKVIILTGAMQPAEFVHSDAAINFGGALIAAQILSSGVYIVMNGKVFNALTARKNTQTNRFE